MAFIKVKDNEKVLLKIAKEKIDSCSCISFDIFDTLLLRPYLNPQDLFWHLEKIEDAPGFAQARITAERTAIKHKKASNQEEITFDEIYELIDTRFSHFKQKELDFERKILTQNPEIFEIYNYALSARKKIIIVSDMYLPKDFLETVLIEKGYSNFHKLFISSESGKRKSSSNLYKEIQKELEISFENILHIGDNYESDYKIAKNLGINTLLYEKVSDQFLKANNKARLFLKKYEQTLDVSILFSIFAIRWHKQKIFEQEGNYWQRLGYYFGGPACYAFMEFMKTDLTNKQIKEVLFVARDGYSLEKVFNIITNNSFKTNYVYAPRFMNIISRLDFDSPLAAVTDSRRKAFFDYVNGLDDASVQGSTLVKTESEGLFLEKNLDYFKELSEKEMDKYRKYLNSLNISSEKIASVDSITISFSSQQLISDALAPKSVIGYFWFAFTKGNKYKNHLFERFLGEDIEEPYEGLIELLMSAPEKPIFRIENNAPVYQKDVSEHELQRIELYPFISEGEVSFALDVKQIFGDNDIFLSYQNIYKWHELFIMNPEKEDKEEMSTVKKTTTFLNSNYVLIFDFWYSRRKNLKRIIYNAKRKIRKLVNN